MDVKEDRNTIVIITSGDEFFKFVRLNDSNLWYLVTNFPVLSVYIVREEYVAVIKQRILSEKIEEDLVKPNEGVLLFAPGFSAIPMDLVNGIVNEDISVVFKTGIE